MDARDIDEPSELRPPMPSRAALASAVQPLYATIWPFVCIVVVLVGIAIADFVLDPAEPSARVLMLVVRLLASVSVVALAGVTLRRLFSQRKNLQEALAASEERFVGSLSDIQKRRQAEALLFEELDSALETIAAIDDGVVTFDSECRSE
jgi:hypothetical protein